MSTSNWIGAFFRGTELAASDECLLVDGYFYFPASALPATRFQPGQQHSAAAQRGTIVYLDVVLPDGQILTNAAWHHPAPDEGFAMLRDRVAFWGGIDIRSVAERSDDRDIAQSLQLARYPATAPADTDNADGPAASADDDATETPPAPAAAIQTRPAEQAHEVAPPLRAFLTRIPKIELRLSLPGLASRATLESLAQQHGQSLPEFDLPARSQAGLSTLYQSIVPLCLRTAADLERLMLGDVRAYLQRNRIVYAELSWSPGAMLAGLPDDADPAQEYAGMLATLAAAAERLRREDNLHIKFLAELSRSAGPAGAERMLDLVLAHPHSALIGVTLGAPGVFEEGQPARDFAPIFERARAAGLHTTVVAGEVAGPAQLREASELLQADRLGHATSAVLDPALLEQLAASQQPLEICLSSNAITRAYIHELAEHPVRGYFENGLKIVPASDAPVGCGSELSDEYLKLYAHCGFSVAELLQLMRDSLTASFLSQRNRTQLWPQIRTRMAALAERYGIRENDAPVAIPE